jgi:hypothetical protein
MDYDILIITGVGDYNKIPFLLDSIRDNIKGYNNIHIISQDSNLVLRDVDKDVIKHTDEETVDEIGLDMNIIKYRPNWIKQQIFKLKQPYTLDNYLVLDADVYINKEVQLFDENNTPYLFITHNQYHKPYFNFMKDAYGIKKEYNHSFISEIMMFNRDVINEISTKSDLIETLHKYIFNLSNDRRLNYYDLSEFELYGNYLISKNKNHPIKKLKQTQTRKKEEYTDLEIEEFIRKNKDFDFLVYHTSK